MDSPLIDRPGDPVDEPDQTDGGRTWPPEDGSERGPLRVGWALLGWPLLVVVGAVLLFRWRGTDRAFLLAVVGLTPALVVPLTVGAVADVAVWRLDGPAFAGVLDDLIEGWLRAGPLSAWHTIVAGRPIVRDGQLVDEKLDEMLALHRTISRRFQPEV